MKCKSLALLFLAHACLGSVVLAQTKPGHFRLENMDRRTTREPTTVAGAPAEARLQAEHPGATVDFDLITGSPKFIHSRSGLLTTRPAADVAAANAPPPDPYTITRTFLDRYRELFRHSATALDPARVRRDFVTPHNRLRTIVWGQELDGLPVHDAVLISHCTAAGEIVALSSQFMADPDRAANAGALNRAGLIAAPPITMEQAVARAAQDLGDAVAASAVRRVPEPAPAGSRRQRLTTERLLGEAYAQLTWLPTAPERLRLCWEILLTSRVRHEMFRVLVDAQNGDIWIRHSLTAYATEATYRVYTSDSPSPLSPGHPVPLTNQPSLVPRVLVVTNALSLNASPNGWINDGLNETRGNNVEAHTDLDDNDQPDLPRPHGAPSRIFDFPVDLTQAPSTYRPASVVQLFYWCNWMHDQLYELGFTEAAGNFQMDNFDRGGLGGDPVQADAQDGGGANNANMHTPPDGVSPRMQMYVFTGPTPDRDGSLDAEVILHEYTHGLSDRRVGGGVGMSRLQSVGMGEGWSDFYGLALLSQLGDDPDGAYPVGGYLSYQLEGLQDNYYFGIRRYPYSTDMGKNPLTFKDIDPTQAIAHEQVPRSSIHGAFSSAFAAEVHNQGEVWGVTLWEARANLVRKHGFATGNRLILQLVTDGMNLSPPNPNFLQARDAVLLADRLNNGGVNLPELWAAFAKRGLGASAISPPSSTTIGVREAFDPADNLNVRPHTDWITTRRADEPFGSFLQTYFLTNSGPATVNWGVHYTASWIKVTPTSGTLAPRAPAQPVTVTLDNAALGLSPGTYVETLFFSNSVTHVVQPRVAQARVIAADFLTEIFEDSANDLDFQSFTFTPDNSPGGYAVCRTPATRFPIDAGGGTTVALGDDEAAQITLQDGAEVSLFGLRTNSLFIGSNGYLTLGRGDSNYFASTFSHFSLPRVSGLFHDLDPSLGGRISWQQLSNLVAVTFLNIPERFGDATNSFQIELFFDGRIRLTYLRLDSTSALVGLSAGAGVPSPFAASDFTAYEICGRPELILAMPTPLAEGTSEVVGMVRVPAAPTANLAVTLASTDPAHLHIPAEIVIPQGQNNATFPIIVSDDQELGGTRFVLVSAGAPGYPDATSLVEIFDTETTALELTLPAETVENIGAVTGRVQIARIPSSSITVRLSTSHTNVVRVPSSILIPAGATSAVWTAQIIDDAKLGGPQAVTVTARVPYWMPATASLLVRDDEPTNLVVTLPLRLREGDGLVPNAGTIRLGGTLANDLQITLDSLDPTELTIPTAITIPAGETMARFDLTVLEDAEIDGVQVVTILAQAAGLGRGQASLEVLDGETPLPPAYPSPQHLASDVSVTADLSWAGGEYTELAVNGGFEEGTFRGWVLRPSFYGDFAINTATNHPPSGDTPLSPFEGTFNALAEQIGPGRHEMYQIVTIPEAPLEVVLRWVDRARNSFSRFDSDQEYRVEIRGTNGSVLAIAHRTQPGDPLLGEWIQRRFDLTPFRGQTVQVAFVVNPGQFFLGVHVDNVSVAARIPGRTEFDVYFGTKPQLDLSHRLGSTTNTTWVLPDLEPATTYYWQIVGRTLGQSAGPVWQFTTHGVDHFVWEPIPTPQRRGQPFEVRLSARDPFDRLVSNFNGTVSLSAAAGTTNVQLFKEDFESGSYESWERNADYGDWTVVNNRAAGGSHSLSLLGGRQTYWDGLSHALPNLTPDVLRFSVQASQAEANGAYLLVGTGPEFEQTAVYFAMFSAGLGLYEPVSGGNFVPFKAGRWYDIELYFSWSNRTVDFFIDGVPQRRGLPFTSPDVDHLSQVFLHNFDYTRSWWDEIEFIQTNQPVFVAISPSQAGPFVNGHWQGQVTLVENAAHLSLHADDGTGHTGTSGSLAVIGDDELLVTMTDEPSPATLTSPITYRVSISNPGPQAASGVTLTNKWSTQTTLESFQSSQGECAAVGGEVQCDLGAMAAGTQITFTAVVRATNYGRFTNTAWVSQTANELLTHRYTNSVVSTVTPPLLSVEDALVVEGNGGRTSAQFRLSLSASNPLPVSVLFFTSNGTATAVSDFVSANGLLVFPPGSTQETVTVLINGDNIREPNETFTLYLRYALNATLTRPRADGIILDDEPSAAAGLPFIEDWESGSADSFWLASGPGGGSVIRSDDTHAGAFHFVMDNPRDDGVDARSELTLTLDLDGAANVVLRFWALGSFFDLPDGPPPSPFLGGADFDGVAISMDGLRWYEVLSLRSLSFDYTEFVVPLDAELAAHDLTYTRDFRIRFNHVGPYALPLSGMALDDISITSTPPGVRAAAFVLTEEDCAPPNQAIDPGETVTALLWLTNAGALPVHQLTATLLTGGNVVGPSASQLYGALVPGGPAVARPFTFAAGGLCRGTLRAALDLVDGETHLGRASFVLPLGKTEARTWTFGEPFSVVIPSNGAAVPFPATRAVSGVTGQVNKVTVTLHDFTHPFPDQVDMLLRGPGGQTVTLFSDTGGLLGVTNVTLIFDSAATNRLGDNDQIYSGTYAPTNYGSADAYPLPAPNPPYGTTLDLFKDVDPNGTWQLFIYDDTLRDGGSLGNWTLQFETIRTECCQGRAAADLSLSMLPVPATVLIDGIVNYNMTVRNLGPDPASNVILSNPLPAGAVFLSATSAVGICIYEAGLLQCRLGVLASNVSASATLTVRAIEPGLLANVASVHLDEREVEPSNNTARASAIIASPALNVQNAIATESSNPNSSAQFVVTLGSTPTRLAEVRFVTADQTALAGVDYQPTNGVLTFLPGETNKTISVLLLDDLLDETNETFTLNLFNPVNVTPSVSQALATLFDNDNPPSMSINNVSVREGDTGLTQAQFQVQLSAPSGQAVSGSFFTANATAAAPLDFLATNGNFVLVPGETSRIVPVLVRGDRLNEPTETFSLRLASIRNALLTDGEGLGTIVNDDFSASFTLQPGLVIEESCVAANGVIDPGEQVAVQFTLRNIAAAGAAANNLIVTLEPGGGVLAPSPAQALGPVAAGATAVSEFRFTAGGFCGGAINATFSLRDGNQDLGSLGARLPIGQAIVTFAENFDQVTPPALPAGWTAFRAGTNQAWRTTTASRDTLPNAVTAPDPASRSTNDLVSPSILINSFQAQLAFRHSFITESNWDGGMLEISVDGSPFVEFLSAGGRFVQGGYNGRIGFSEAGWTGNSGGYATVVAGLPPSVAGLPVQFRWRFTSDTSTGGVGWFVDTVSLTDGFACCGSAPPLITSARVEANLVTVQWIALPGRTYRIQYTTTLDPAQWVDLPQEVTAQSTVASVTDLPAEVGQRFYRVLLLP